MGDATDDTDDSIGFSVTDADLWAAQEATRESPGWEAEMSDDDDCPIRYIGLVATWCVPVWPGRKQRSFAYTMHRDAAGGIELVDVERFCFVGWFPSSGLAVQGAMRRGRA